MTHAGRVSIVIPCFNKAAFLREALDSVLLQEGVEVEVLVIDDASTDGSRSVIEAYADRIRAHLLPGNRGAPYARNLGARLATGAYLMFLDADDRLAPGTLAALVDAAGKRTDRFASCRWQQMREENGRWITFQPAKPLVPGDGDYVRAWLANWYFPPCAVLWPRQLFQASGGWDEALHAWQDTDIMLRMLVRGHGFAVATGGEAYYRVNAAGASVSKISSERSVRSRMRVLEKLRAQLAATGQLERYRGALGEAYHALARGYAAAFPDLALQCLREADRFLGRRPTSGTRVHRLLWRLLGLERKERLTRWLAARGVASRTASGAG